MRNCRPHRRPQSDAHALSRLDAPGDEGVRDQHPPLVGHPNLDRRATGLRVERTHGGRDRPHGVRALEPYRHAGHQPLELAAVHGGAQSERAEVLDPREQRALLDALDAIPWAPTCPHGRPVAVPFELAEIERRFARR